MRQHGGAGMVLIAAVAGLGCQTEQALQPTPVDHGEQRSGRTMLADTELQQRLEANIAHEPLLAAARIQVAINGGVVRLRGVVLSHAQHARAREVARALHGVRRIDDQLIRHGRSGVADGPLPQLQLHL